MSPSPSTMQSFMGQTTIAIRDSTSNTLPETDTKVLAQEMETEIALWVYRVAGWFLVILLLYVHTLHPLPAELFFIPTSLVNLLLCGYYLRRARLFPYRFLSNFVLVPAANRDAIRF